MQNLNPDKDHKQLRITNTGWRNKKAGLVECNMKDLTHKTVRFAVQYSSAVVHIYCISEIHDMCNNNEENYHSQPN